MNKIINLGKIDFYGTGEKTNKVDIEIKLKEEGTKKIFSVCANVWNARNSDVICAGQCLDELQPFFKNNKLFKEIYKLWNLYHLNDMHAGTKRQENFLKKNNIKNWANNYEEVCEFLDINNLLYDNEIKFGTTWHYWEIPEKDLKKIYEIIEKK